MKDINFFHCCFNCEKQNASKANHQHVLRTCRFETVEKKFKKINITLTDNEDTSKERDAQCHNIDKVTKKTTKKSTRKSKYLIRNWKRTLRQTSKKCAVAREENYCNNCNKRITTEFQSHLDSKYHRKNKISEHYYMMETIKKSLVCKICQTYIPDNCEAVEEHCRTEDHYRKYMYDMEINKIEINEKIKCLLCDVEIAIKDELAHIEGRKHRGQKDVNFSPLKGDHFCYICDLNVPFDEFKKHLTSVTHLKKVEVRSGAQLDFNKCKVCNVEVFDSPKGRNEHRRNMSHKKRYLKRLAEQKVVLCQNKTKYCHSCVLHFEEHTLEHIDETNHRMH